MRSRTTVRAFAAAAVAVAALAPGSEAAARAPKVEQLVVFRDGSAKQKNVTAAKATARVGHKRCAVSPGTTLAALLHSGVGPLKLKDFGACSARPADAAGIYVRAIAK